jgi:hypothetical protein
MNVEKILYTNMKSGTMIGTLCYQIELKPGTESPSSAAKLIISHTSKAWSDLLYFPLPTGFEQGREDELDELFDTLKSTNKNVNIIVNTLGSVLFKWYKRCAWIIAEANSSGYTGVFSNELHFQARDVDHELPFTPESTQRFVDISRLDNTEYGFKLICKSEQPWRILNHSKERYTMELYDGEESTT